MINLIKNIFKSDREKRRDEIGEAFKEDFPIDLREGCPDCAGKKFAEGPSGGVCMNVKCKCGSEFNLNTLSGWAHRI